MRKNFANQYKVIKIDTFRGGGEGGTLFYGQNDFMDIWAFLKFVLQYFWCPTLC